MSFVLAALFLLVILARLYVSILKSCDGVFVYGLDDTYIHLSIVRTLLNDGVYGVHAATAGFASSSQLWPLLLTGIAAVGGLHDLLPLAINTVLALLTLLLIDRIALEEGLSAAGRLLLLVIVIIIQPVGPAVFNGMEHVLHTFLSILLLWRWYRMLKGEGDRRSQTVVLLLLLLAILARYESVAFAASMLVVHLFRKEWRQAAVITVASIAAVAIAALFMTMNGGYWLPNSVLLKGYVFTLPTGSLNLALTSRFAIDQALDRNWIILLLALLALLRSVVVRDKHAISLLVALILAYLLQLANSWDGLLYRYAMYMSSSALLFSLIILLRALMPGDRQWSMVARLPVLATTVTLALMLLYPLLRDGLAVTRRSIPASVNIYEQQYQTARFLQRYYAGERVALNDIGLPVYMGGVIPIDLVGLAHNGIASAYMSSTMGTDSIRSVVTREGARIAVLYDEWFHGRNALPEEWIRVGEWSIAQAVVCAHERVVFYAVNPEEAVGLAEVMTAFASELPESVDWRLVYMGDKEK
jgi:hypothetical protein